MNNKTQVQALIDVLIKKDAHFAEAYKTRKDKSLDKFIQYFFSCAQDAYIKQIGRKNGCMTDISSDDVNALLVHYWTEDNPKVGDIELTSFKGMEIKTATPKPASAPTPPKPGAPKAAPKTPSPAKPAAPKAAAPTAPPTAIPTAAPKAAAPKPAAPPTAIPKPPVASSSSDDDDDFDLD